MNTFTLKVVSLTTAVSLVLPMAGCQQMGDFMQKNPELAGGTIGALSGAGLGAILGGKDHRAGGAIIGAIGGAIAGGLIGHALHKSEERKASDEQRHKAEADARAAREAVVKQDPTAAARLQKPDAPKQMVPVARDESTKQTAYVLVDPKTGIAGEEAYVFDDVATDQVLADSNAGKLSQLDGQEVVYTPSLASAR